MYEEYAIRAGFCTRMGTIKKEKVEDKEVTKIRYMLCSRASKPKCKVGEYSAANSVSPSRHSNIKVTDCKACIKFRRVKDSPDYEVYDFVEHHNHGLVAPQNHDLLRKKRKLDFPTQEFIATCRNANLGPTKSHKVHVVLKGGHHNVHGTVTDYKNFGRDIRDFIGDRDAQMIIEKYEARRQSRENYTFETHCVGTELQLLFWCDGVSKTNYEAFGDVVVFDATYHTNM